MNDHRRHWKWRFGLTIVIVIIILICGIIHALPGMVQAGQSGEGLPFRASTLPDLSGLVWMEDDLFLAVHDAKNPEEIERPRASLIQLPNGPDGISWKQLNLQLKGQKSNDLESAARIPGTQQVLLVESTQEKDDKSSSRRIILAEFFHKRLRIVDVIDWPIKTWNVEGTAVAQIGERLIFVYAERAENSASTDIMFADLELEPLSFGEFEKLGTFTIGIGTPLTERPSHTTQHTGPYCAIRLIRQNQIQGNTSPSDLKCKSGKAICTHLTLLIRQGPFRAQPVVNAWSL